jgi:hypothetical protein
MIFKGLYCTFGRIDLMIMGFYQEEVTFLLCEESFYFLAGLVVHDIQFDFVPFAFKQRNFLLYASKIISSSIFEIGRPNIVLDL